LQSTNDHVVYNEIAYRLAIFGSHNLENMNAARLACAEIGINSELFFKSIQDFKGAGNRLELVSDNPLIYRDFAHAPSKVRATVNAVRERYPDDRILAILELHTYSSLNEEFLPHYADTMLMADEAIVFFDPEAVKLKRLPSLDKTQISKHFAHDQLIVLDNREDLERAIIDRSNQYEIALLMSSGKFGGMNIIELVEKSSVK
jgi:UDP-N-acetylmuramate: L-alanyl-gamma-D-glutamyl-meso-diaminopimelate ligase